MAQRLKKANPASVYKALRKKFGARGTYAKKDAVEHIVFSILLTGASPEDTQKAFSALRSAYVDWNEVRVTGLKELSSLLESKGCVPKKAEFIKAFLQKLYIDSHMISAQLLQKMSTKRAFEYVGETTGLPSEQVAAILFEIFDIPVIPIDKQIKYAFVRLGLVKMRATPTQVQKTFSSLASKGKAATAYRVLHILVTEYCRKDEQLCPSCPVKKHCPTGHERIMKIREARNRKPAAKKVTQAEKKKK